MTGHENPAITLRVNCRKKALKSVSGGEGTFETELCRTSMKKCSILSQISSCGADTDSLNSAGHIWYFWKL